MKKIRHWLSIFIILSTFSATCAFAQSTLTQVQDTVLGLDGTPFNGTVVITWTGSTNTTGNSPAPYNTSVKIYNGALSVLLVPSTTVSPTGYYQALYSSSNGLANWSETWSVPRSATPVTLSQIRVSNPVQGGGGAQFPISQVSGLSSYLGALNGSLVSLTGLFNGLNSTVGGLSNSVATLTAQIGNLSGITNANFVDAQTPAGTVDGTDATFTLSQTPGPAGTLSLYRNGILLTSGVDYTLSGATIAFGGNDIPKPGDVLQAYYRTAGTGPAATLVDNEIPQGAIDGSNLTFTLNAAPGPVLSLQLYKNGALLQQGNDYTLSGATISFVNTSSTPQPGDSLSAEYRTTAGTH